MNLTSEVRKLSVAAITAALLFIQPVTTIDVAAQNLGSHNRGKVETGAVKCALCDLRGRRWRSLPAALVAIVTAVGSPNDRLSVRIRRHAPDGAFAPASARESLPPWEAIGPEYLRPLSSCMHRNPD